MKLKNISNNAMYSSHVYYFLLSDDLCFNLGIGFNIHTPESGRKRKRGRPRMRWEDCVKRDLERVGGEWRTTAKYRTN